MLAQVIDSPRTPTPALRTQDFTRMNPLIFHDSKLDKDPQKFIDNMDKVVEIIRVSSKKKVKLAAYQLKELHNFGSLNESWKELKKDILFW